MEESKTKDYFHSQMLTDNKRSNLNEFLSTSGGQKDHLEEKSTGPTCQIGDPGNRRLDLISIPAASVTLLYRYMENIFCFM